MKCWCIESTVCHHRVLDAAQSKSKRLKYNTINHLLAQPYWNMYQTKEK